MSTPTLEKIALAPNLKLVPEICSSENKNITLAVRSVMQLNPELEPGTVKIESGKKKCWYYQELGLDGDCHHDCNPPYCDNKK